MDSQEDLLHIYNKTLEMAKSFPSSLVNDLSIHDVHKASIGSWPSTPVVMNLIKDCVKYPFDYPPVDNGIVVPLLDQQGKLVNLKIISKQSSGKLQIKGLGVGNQGWFNIVGSGRSLALKTQEDYNQRLLVHESLPSALQYAFGVWSDNLKASNLDQLTKVSLRLALKGSMDFLRAFQFVEGFDITVGRTDKKVWDLLGNDFIFEELLGLDLRVMIPRARDYAKGLPLWEREEFNDKLIKFAKIDLKIYAPLLFEHFTDERTFYEKLTHEVGRLFFFRNLKFNELSCCFQGDIHRLGRGQLAVNLKISEDSLEQVVSRSEGSLIDFVEKITPIPLKYWWDATTEQKRTRVELHNTIKKTLYMVFLALLKTQKNDN